MVDLDEGLQEWRYRHVKMVERTIGDKSGTGGSSGAAYLRGTTFTPVFPDLWAVQERAVNDLARHYSRFRVGERLAADRAFAPGVAGCRATGPDRRVPGRGRWRRRPSGTRRSWSPTGCATVSARCSANPDADIALGQNTHELVLRFLSALDLRARPRLITSDGEFHTLRRQLARLGEVGIELVVVPNRSGRDAGRADGRADRRAHRRRAGLGGAVRHLRDRARPRPPCRAPARSRTADRRLPRAGRGAVQRAVRRVGGRRRVQVPGTG